MPANQPTKQAKKQENPVAVYDLTMPEDRYTLDEMKTFFRAHCKKWCFQKEEGSESGFVHWQCRVSLKERKRPKTAIRWINLPNNLPGGHLTPTSEAVALSGDNFYVMKEDTRLEGPWDNVNDMLPTRYIPLRFRKEPNWKPWQKSVIDSIAVTADDRTVNVIIDLEGCHGKSFLGLYLFAHGKGGRLPVVETSKDILRAVQNAPKSSVYFFDMPRASKPKQMNATYASIEEIKNGYCCEDRYRWSPELFEPPHVWVFCNFVPDSGLLSRGRWIIWTINKNEELVLYGQKPPPEPKTLSLKIILEPGDMPPINCAWIHQYPDGTPCNKDGEPLNAK